MPIYDWECVNGHRLERFFTVAEKPTNVKCRCGLWASQVMPLVAIHTIASFSKDIMDQDVQRSRMGSGEYVDPTLSFDPETNKFTGPITSPRQREKLIKERGLYEKPQTDRLKETDSYKRRKPKSFSATGTRA